MAVRNLDPQLVDRRVIQRNLEKKRISQEEFEAYLNSLKDSKENSELVDIDEETI